MRLQSTYSLDRWLLLPRCNLAPSSVNQNKKSEPPAKGQAGLRLVARVGATKSTSVEFLVTVIAVLIGTLLLHERFSTIQVAGALSIVGGCALVLELVPWKPT